jgi:hypothetical protein
VALGEGTGSWEKVRSPGRRWAWRLRERHHKELAGAVDVFPKAVAVGTEAKKETLLDARSGRCFQEAAGHGTAAQVGSLRRGGR